MTWSDGDLRKEKILAYIRDYIEFNGYCPTRQEVADGVEMARNTTDRHIKMMMEKGLLLEEPNTSRTLRLNKARTE